MLLDKRQRRNLGIIGAIVTLGAGAYALYCYLQKEKIKDEQIGTRYTRRPITIVLSESILSSNIPINEILSKTSEVVVVIPPDLTVDDLNEQLDPSVEYKVIECDTFEGMWSVVKHLNSETIFIVKDDLAEDIPEGLESELSMKHVYSNVLTRSYPGYVGEIVELEQNSTVINESILSYIIA
jgi:hypothetical protein